MSAIANWVAGGDVENLFNAECVPNGIWELHKIGRRRRCVVAYKDGRPIKVPLVSSGGYRRGNAQSHGNEEDDRRGWVDARWWSSGLGVRKRSWGFSFSYVALGVAFYVTYVRNGRVVVEAFTQAASFFIMCRAARERLGSDFFVVFWTLA